MRHGSIVGTANPGRPFLGHSVAIALLGAIAFYYVSGGSLAMAQAEQFDKNRSELRGPDTHFSATSRHVAGAVRGKTLPSVNRQEPPVHAGFIGVQAPADYYVEDVDVDAQGFLYSTDSYNDRIRKFAPDQSVVLEINDPVLRGPRYLSVAPDGRIYVSDTTARIVYVYGSNGQYLDEWSLAFEIQGIDAHTPGRVIIPVPTQNRVAVYDDTGQELFSFGTAGDGPGEFDRPNYAVTGADGSIYVVDWKNQRIQVFDQGGNFLLAFGSVGSGDGQFSGPKGVAVDSVGNIFVTDRGNDRVQKFSPTGAFLGAWGTRGRGPGLFFEMEGIAVAPDDSVWVAGFHAYDMQRFDNDGNFLERIVGHISGEGEFSDVRGIVLSGGVLFAVDGRNNRIQVFDTDDGAFLYEFGERDEGLATVFSFPQGISAGPDGDLYIADDRFVRRVQPDGTFVRRYDDLPGPRSESADMAISADGFMYQTDRGNELTRKTDIATGLLVDSWSGSGTAFGEFLNPWGIELGSNGILYVANLGKSRVQLFDTNGNFLNEWVTPAPRALALDEANGVMYVGSWNRITTFDLAGNELSAWGTLGSGPGQMNTIFDIVLHDAGNTLFVSEFGNGRVQRFVFENAPSDVDSDGVDDAVDNCTLLANADQTDTDSDNIGNRCDADLNNDCFVNGADLGLLKTEFFASGSAADFDGDGTVNVVDLGIMRLMFFMAPGPSGLINACDG